MPPQGGMFAWVNMVFPDDIDGVLPPARPPLTPLNKRERAVVIDRIVSLMQFWGITLDDLSADVIPETAPQPLPDLPAVRAPEKAQLSKGFWSFRLSVSLGY